MQRTRHGKDGASPLNLVLGERDDAAIAIDGMVGSATALEASSAAGQRTGE